MITWIVLRAAGVAAYVMLFASVAWGLIATTSAFGKRVAKATAVAVHQFLSTVALVFLTVHLGGLLVDRFMPFRPLDVLVPLRVSYRPVAVAFGIAAMYAMLIVLVSSWLQKRVGTTWWRRLHLLAAPTFILSMVHGVFAGTDTARPWMWWVYVGTGSILLFLVVLRGLTAGLRPVRAGRPATAAKPSVPAHVPAAAPARTPRGARKLATAPFPVRAGASTNGNGHTPRPQPERRAALSETRTPSHDESRDVVIHLEVRVQVGEDGVVRPITVRPSSADPEKPALESSNGNGHRPRGDLET